MSLSMLFDFSMWKKSEQCELSLRICSGDRFLDCLLQHGFMCMWKLLRWIPCVSMKHVTKQMTFDSCLPSHLQLGWEAGIFSLQTVPIPVNQGFQSVWSPGTPAWGVMLLGRSWAGQFNWRRSLVFHMCRQCPGGLGLLPGATHLAGGICNMRFPHLPSQPCPAFHCSGCGHLQRHSPRPTTRQTARLRFDCNSVALDIFLCFSTSVWHLD